MRYRSMVASVVLPLALAAGAAGAAQPVYPDKPIRVIIGSAPGSGPDIVSRLLGDRLYATWGQRVIVDSRPGVAGALSAELALRANPDGYTWMVLTSQLFIATTVYPDLKFNLDKDFVSIALIGSVPFVQAVNPQVPAKSIQELAALAKKAPGKLRYGSSGEGSTEHLCGLMFSRLTGADMLHVPYKGIAQAIADTLANEIQITYPVVPAVRAHIEAGRLRALGVTSRKRAPLLPDVPTIGEIVPGYALFGWYSVVAPKGTPEPILAKASAEVVKIVKEPEFEERLKAQGIDVIGGTRTELDEFRREQRKTLTELVKSAGVVIR